MPVGRPTVPSGDFALLINRIEPSRNLGACLGRALPSTSARRSMSPPGVRPKRFNLQQQAPGQSRRHRASVRSRSHSHRVASKPVDAQDGSDGLPAARVRRLPHSTTRSAVTGADACARWLRLGAQIRLFRIAPGSPSDPAPNRSTWIRIPVGLEAERQVAQGPGQACPGLRSGRHRSVRSLESGQSALPPRIGPDRSSPGSQRRSAP